MRVFVDTNVVLDVLAKREPHYRDSAAVWTLAEQGRIQGLVSAVTFTNLFYIVRRLEGAAAARRALTLVRGSFTPVACDAQVIQQALDAGRGDFEDAVQYFSALRGEAAYIVTRNVDHFPAGDLPVVSPAEFLAALSLE
jgi:predicted nucleic acid-binding protein